MKFPRRASFHMKTRDYLQYDFMNDWRFKTMKRERHIKFEIFFVNVIHIFVYVFISSVILLILKLYKVISQKYTAVDLKWSRHHYYAQPSDGVNASLFSKFCSVIESAFNLDMLLFIFSTLRIVFHWI